MDAAGWVASLDTVLELISGRFARAEPRRRVGAYLHGLLAGLERKNGWTLAEHAGALSPDGMQRLLRTADWDIDGVRDDVRGYVLTHLGAGAAGVFIIDETGFIKKGVRSAGVQRQYTATTGKVENCQMGVFLGYASPRGRALVDRELYLPTSWTDDPDRCAAAGIPVEVGFLTKPRLGVAMLARAHAAGVLTGWVTANVDYGQNPRFRSWLADHGVPFVLETRNDDVLISPHWHRRQAKVLVTLAGTGDDDDWVLRRIEVGVAGERAYDWTAVALDAVGLPAGWGHWLLVRREAEPESGESSCESAFYRCAGPVATPLRELIRVAGARRAIQECFRSARDEAGLDQYQVRDWRAWYAHITLALLAAACVAITATDVAATDRDPEKGDLEPVSTI